MEEVIIAPFKTIKSINSALEELWNIDMIEPSKLWFKSNVKAITDNLIVNTIVETICENYIIGHDQEILFYLNNHFKYNSLDSLIKKWKKKKIKKRVVSTRRIFESYDMYGEKLSVIMFNRNTKKKLFSLTGLNVLESLREFSKRSTFETICVLCLGVNEINKFEIKKYDDAIKYKIQLDDYFGGIIPKKKSEIIVDEEIDEELEKISKNNGDTNLDKEVLK